MMTETIKAFHELWNQDEIERSEIMGHIEDPEPVAADEEMFSDLISIFGLEHPVIINFAHIMEQGIEIKSLKIIYTTIIENLNLYMFD